ncbi:MULTISPECIES: ferric iron uptake transcriptional regulator [unclassified Paenibacillus]|uniref:ferric iron uptake transcriptional regulator n=1 Tax=unclassified Paenibacillus TaxID=185978 RepID=UPI00362C5D1D
MMNIMEEIDKINQQLRIKGYKMTPQREITLKVLLENEKDHLSAEEVFMLVKERHSEIGIATVYRTLELFAELHIVEKMNFGDGVARFDLRGQENTHMHHHLICNVCGALKEIKEDWLGQLEERVKHEYGFQVTDHRLDFTGVFNNCKNTECKREGKAKAV